METEWPILGALFGLALVLEPAFLLGGGGMDQPRPDCEQRNAVVVDQPICPVAGSDWVWSVAGALWFSFFYGRADRDSCNPKCDPNGDGQGLAWRTDVAVGRVAGRGGVPDGNWVPGAWVDRLVVHWMADRAGACPGTNNACVCTVGICECAFVRLRLVGTQPTDGHARHIHWRMMQVTNV